MSAGVDAKLVRDKIPQIVRDRGLEPIIEVAGDAEYRELLRTKLLEETQEFLSSDGDVEELADVIEVVRALALQLGVDPDQLEQIRRAKEEQRGGFLARVVWKGNRPL
jgi:predicted house-cleaning noncanonical NTP pyrophosphatase (MazG superfamily)